MPEIVPVASSEPAEAVVPDAADPAGTSFGLRVGGRIIDLVIHTVFGLATALVVGVVLAVLAAGRGQPFEATAARLGQSQSLDYLLAILGLVAYHTICESFHGSTLGKALVGITVRAEDGGPASLSAAGLRSLAAVPESLLLGLPAAISINSSPRQQRYGDKWAHTIVVRTKALPPAARRSVLRLLVVAALGLFADGAFQAIALVIKL